MPTIDELTDNITPRLHQIEQDITAVKAKVDAIYQGLYGLAETKDNGLLGLIQSLSASHYKLRQQFWTLVAFLVGSGILGAGGILAALLQ